MKVNSTHHQAIKQVGNGLRVSARSDDGIVEALESKKKGFLIGVQWHPESLTVETPAFKELFQRFVSEAEKFSFFPKKG